MVSSGKRLRLVPGSRSTTATASPSSATARSQSAKMGDEAKKSEPESSNSVAASPASTSDDFDMENLFKYFSECYGEDGSALRMDSYIKGYEEIVKFLNLLGTVFGWVASDVVAKISTLKGHVNSEETGSHYVSIQTMTAYEVKENLIKYKARDSTTGSRNLLRLQRALEYIIAFMVKVPGILHMKYDVRT